MTNRFPFKKQPVIFCDFDGTITVNDNIIAIMKYFNPPGWETTVEHILAKQISIRTGVGHMFSLLPTAKRAEIEQYAVHNISIRAGFQELLDFCRDTNVTFLVTSGGIDFFVYPTMSPFAIEPQHIFCNGSDFNGTSIRVTWPHPCDAKCQNDCGMCKTTIMRRYPQDSYLRIVIGDSITDLEGAKIADHVFARSHLVESCRQLGIDFYEYADFHQVKERLKEVLACQI